MSVTLREEKLPSGKIRLRLDIYQHGKRRFENTNIILTGNRQKDKQNRELAEAIRAKLELQLHNNEHGFTDTTKKKLNFYTYAESFYSSKSLITKSVYVNALSYLKALAGNMLAFEQITPALCSDYKNFLLSGKPKDEVRGIKKRNTAAAYYSRFRIIIHHAIDDGYLQSNPTKGISITEEENLPRYLSEGELQKLAGTKCGNEDIRDAFFFSCQTGLRFGDIITLSWKQISGDEVRLLQKKTKREINIPLSAQAKSILAKRKQYSKTQQGVFDLPRRSTVDKVLKRWAKRAGIDFQLSFHKARHTFGTMVFDKTSDIYTTSELMGHKNLSTTLIYAKVKDAKRASAIGQLPVIPGV